MKINPINTVATQYQKVQSYSQKEQRAYSFGTDSLELSDQAKLFTDAMLAAKRAGAAEPIDKQARIDQLKAQVEQDAYNVDIADICKKILLV